MPNKAATAEAEVPTEANADGTTPEAAEKPVKVIVREMWAEKKSRSEIAKALGISYQRVFSLTKDAKDGGPEGAASGSRPRVMLEGLEGEDVRFNGVARIEAIRTLFGEGIKVGPIAKRLGCSYQIVFQATRSLREAASTATDAEDGTEVEETDDESTEPAGAIEEPDDTETEPVANA